MPDKQVKKIVTHNSRFHADDVFAVAVLKELFGDEPEYIRTRDQAIIDSADIVVDVGNVYDPAHFRFDHHQVGRAGVRPNGIEYASFGLVWKHFGEKLAGSQEVADRIDAMLVQAVDAPDNGIDTIVSKIPGLWPLTFQSLVFAYGPTWKEDESSLDGAFFEVVEIARKILHRFIIQAKDFIEAKQFVEEAYAKRADPRIMVIDKKYPYEELVTKMTDVLYVVLPSQQDGHWKVECARDTYSSFKNRKNMPAAWGGKRDAELAAVTGVPGSLFCHTGLFLAVADTKEGALELAKLAANA